MRWSVGFELLPRPTGSCDPPHGADICTDGAKTNVGQTSGQRAVARNLLVQPVCSVLKVKQKQFHLLFLIKSIYPVKSQPLSIAISMLCVKKHQVRALHSTVQGLSQGRDLCTATEPHTESVTRQVRLAHPSLDVLSKMNKAAL